MTIDQKLKLYVDSLTKWLNARKHYPAINHGDAPMPKDYHLTSAAETWAAEQHRKRTINEFQRSA